MLILSVIGIIKELLSWVVLYEYKLIIEVYNLFILVSKVSFLRNETITKIFNRFQIMLYVVMVFYISFTVVKYIINPETTTDKEKGTGGLIKRVIITILLMAFTPKLFEIATNVRYKLIESDFIRDMLFDKSTTISAEQKARGGQMSGGQKFATDTLSLFYKVNEKVPNARCKTTFKIGIVDTGLTTSTIESRKVVENGLKIMRGDKLDRGFDGYNFAYCIDEQIDTQEYGSVFIIDFLPILAIGFGLFLIYVLLMFSIEVGKNVFQLAFLQAIAPIPVMCYLSPGKDGTFYKWAKKVLMCYVDVLLRLFIIYLMLFFCDELMVIVKDSFSGGRSDFFGIREDISTFAKIVIIIVLLVGLLLFALEAPKLIKDLLPKGIAEAGGSLGFGKDARKNRYRALSGAKGAVRGVGKGIARGAQRAKHNVKNGNWTGKPIKDAKRARARKKYDRAMARQQKKDNAAALAANQKKLNAAKEKGYEDFLNKKRQQKEDKRRMNSLANAREKGMKDLNSLKAQRDMLRNKGSLTDAERAQLHEIEGKISGKEGELAKVSIEMAGLAASRGINISKENSQMNEALSKFATADEKVKSAEQSYEEAMRVLNSAAQNTEEYNNAIQKRDAAQAAITEGKKARDEASKEASNILNRDTEKGKQDLKNAIEDEHNAQNEVNEATEKEKEIIKKLSDKQSKLSKAMIKLEELKKAGTATSKEISDAEAVVNGLNNDVSQLNSQKEEATKTTTEKQKRLSDATSKKGQLENLLKEDTLDDFSKTLNTNNTNQQIKDHYTKELGQWATDKNKEIKDLYDEQSRLENVRVIQEQERKKMQHESSTQSVLGGFISGTVSGIVGETKKGLSSEATNIVAHTKENIQNIGNVITNEVRREQFYEQGNDVGIKGAITRNIVTPLHMGTTSQSITESIKPMQDKIASTEKYIKENQDVITSYDTSRSKMFELIGKDKVKVQMAGDSGLGFVAGQQITMNGEKYTLKANDTTSSVLAYYNAVVDKMQSQLDTAIKANDSAAIDMYTTELSKARTAVGHVNAWLRDATFRKLNEIMVEDVSKRTEEARQFLQNVDADVLQAYNKLLAEIKRVPSQATVDILNDIVRNPLKYPDVELSSDVLEKYLSGSYTTIDYDGVMAISKALKTANNQLESTTAQIQTDIKRAEEAAAAYKVNEEGFQTAGGSSSGGNKSGSSGSGK